MLPQSLSAPTPPSLPPSLSQPPPLIYSYTQTYADYNALVAKDPAYVESGKDVEHVVRTTNLQM